MNIRWRRWLGWTGVSLATLALLLAATAYLAIERQPRVTQVAAFTPEHIERAIRLFDQHDPRNLKPGTQDTISVRQDDLDLAVNYLASRYGRTSSRIALKEGAAAVQTSTLLPRTPFGRYLNLRMELRETEGLPHIDHLRIGRLPVSPYLANHLVRFGLKRLRAQTAGAGVAVDSIRQVTARGGVLNVAYTWPGRTPGAAQASLWSAADQVRIQAYGALLAEWTAGAGKARAVPLATLVQPLLQHAARRSDGRVNGADAVAENRAAVVALALFVNGKSMGAALQGLAQGMPMATRPITLGGRPDTAQHFTVSAALAATAGSPLSDAVGLYKELNDARGGSGFSFNDLAADRAGTRFGERATANDTEARKLQGQLAQSLREADFLPKVKDLPESLQHGEFTRRFGGVGGPGYQRLRDDIETRIAALPLYR